MPPASPETAASRPTGDEAPPHPSAWTGIGLCALAAMLDGIDMQAMALVAPKVMQEWSVSPSSFGLVLSAAPLGMVVGALTLGPAADRFGRRPTMIVSIVAVGIATALIAGSSALWHLVILRALAGIAMGGIVSSAITLSAELASPRARPAVAALVFAGVPLGGAVAAASAVLLLDVFGWRTLFLLWGAAPLAVALPLIAFLPESPSFLAGGVRQALPQRRSKQLPRIFDAVPLWPTLALWLGLILAFQATYFFAFWLPSLLERAGLGGRTALSTIIFLNGGALPGAAVLGWLMTRWSPRIVVPGCYVLAALAACLTASNLTPGPGLAVLVFLLGFLTLGGQVATAALIASIYTSEFRATGVGWATGMGRIGAVTGPIIGGILIASALSGAAVLFIVAFAQLLVGVLLRLGSSSMKERQ